MADIEEIIKENKENKPWGLSPYRMDKNWFEERIDEYATLGLDYIFLGSADITSAGYDYITNRGFVIRVQGIENFQERIKGVPLDLGKERYNDGIVIPKGVELSSEKLKKLYPVIINSYEHLAEYNEQTEEVFYAELARKEAKTKEDELSAFIVKEVPLAEDKCEDKCIIARIIEKLFG